MKGIEPSLPRPVPFILLGLLVPLLLVLLQLWLGGEYERWDRLRGDADESFRRRGTLVDILSEVRAAEASQRGYVITGDGDFLSDYRDRRARAEQSLTLARRLHRDMMAHRASVNDLSRIARAKLVEMDQVLRIYAEAGPEAARLRVSDGEGKRLMARLEQQLATITAKEQRLGASRVATYVSRADTLQRIIWILTAFTCLLLALALYIIWRQRIAQYEVELRAFESAQRNETILNSTIDPIIIVNPSGSIETINKAATEMLGYDAASLARRDFDVIADIAPGVGSFLERIGLEDGRLRTPYWTDRRVRHQNGHWIPVDIALGMMELPDGDHIVVSLRDIAERKRVEQLKDDLISTVSHELRTPLTSIVGALGLLRLDPKNQLEPEAAGLVAIAENNAQRLIRLINDMLDVDRIETGKLRLALQPIDLRDVVLRACEDNLGLARSANTMLVHDVPDEALIVQGDSERLLQVITNLISNAVKVSPSGEQVKVSVTRSSEGKRALVQVEDDGPGVPEEFRPRIFGRFERAANDLAAPGTGLGLAIAREIVGQHGGELWFEDREKGGTRFAFSLAVTQPVALSAEIAGDAKILICESNTVVARMLQSQLTEEGYACRIVDSAQAARTAIAANGYKLLLLDTALDDVDAFSFAREVRQKEGPEELSILLVSPQEGDAQRPLHLDLIDWIEKPIDASRVKAAVAASLRHSDVERPTVLHLDDDQDTLEITASALRGIAYILKATTLAEARELLRYETPHLAILDVHLEHGMGLDLLPDLVDGNGAAIPTIIYSAHDMDISTAGQIDAVLVKSRTSLPDLKATVRRVVATRHRKGEADNE